MLRKKRLTTGITALGTSERYPKTRLQLLKDSQKPANWWERSWVVLLMMFLLSAADFASLYAIFSDILAQNPVFLVIFTGVMCLVLTFLPIIFAHLLRLRHDRLADVPEVFLILIPVVLLILLGVIFWVRFATRNLEFYTENLMQSIGTGSVSQQVNSSPAAMPMVFILTFLPIGIAAVNFFIAWNCDPLSHKIHKLEKRRLHLFENKVQLDAFLAEYSSGEYRNRLKEEDDAKYLAALNTLEAERENLRDYFRARLAEHLGDPVSISILSVPHPVNSRVKPLPETAGQIMPATMEGAK